MLPKHSRDIVYIVVILVLIAIMVGVPSEFWTVIIVNILIISTGLIYVKLTSIEEKVETTLQLEKEKKKEKVSENPYITLHRFAEIEKDECDEDADYDSFDAIRDSHMVIAKYMSGELPERKLISDVTHICKTKLLIYYLGLESILKANAERMNVLDKQYIDIGIKLLKASHFDKKTPTLDFINKTHLM